ncbi:lipopolysaccharide biosynthesis protein [Rhodoferax saidenbachensis]|uniref:O-antigen/teichoic acid export membrane protein n=1 Tax=Rhodoferax saidenbachensis TaxID=1484693 RepID=A0ABU1ZJA3_9BURK|nr:lipopolysaccharide biosynthesis protein [Rhodoferax saidenbachensis]MDR7305631.1 O-antigen/teichoic acid export membrane protein [Rhodoferax saidenbachensis]
MATTSSQPPIRRRKSAEPDEVMRMMWNGAWTGAVVSSVYAAVQRKTIIFANGGFCDGLGALGQRLACLFVLHAMTLAKQGVKAVKWSAIATVARFAMQFAAQVLLARLLGPENYGVFGIGMVVLTLTNVFSNFGFGWSLLHRKTVSEEDIRFAFTWQLVVGGAATLGLFLLAPTLSVFFHEPRVESVIRWLALTCVISAMSSPAGNLMHRDLNFKAAGLIQIGGYVAGYLLVGIPLALLGYGVHALVAAWLVQVTFIALGSFWAHPHSVKPLFHYAGAADALQTGGTVFVTNIINWCLNSMDRFLLSKFANAHSVGVYSVGYNLATMPSTLLMGSLQPAFTAASSKIQDDPNRMRTVYMQIFATVWVLVLPMFVFLSVISFDLVKFLYGPKWLDTGWVLCLLFLSVPAFVCLGLSTPVLWNAGRKHHESLLQLPVLFLGVIGFYYSLPYGIQAFALVAALLVVGRMSLVCWSVFQLLGLSLSDAITPIVRGGGFSVLVAGSAYLGMFLVFKENSPFLSLMVSGILTILTLGFVVFYWPQTIGLETVAMIARFFPKITVMLTRNGK